VTLVSWDDRDIGTFDNWPDSGPDNACLVSSPSDRTHPIWTCPSARTGVRYDRNVPAESTGPKKPTPYGSAKDLPSYQELSRLVQGGKLITLFVARDQRRKLLEVERELARLSKVVDDFYERLGPRNWIFHDQLNVDKIEALLAETTDADAAERRLIELYRDTETTQWSLMRLQGQDGLRERRHQIDRAREHYDADQFDSCVLHLIAVMDGFVNDFEPGVRKGLTSRDPDDMTAWDSVVGHHMGLTHAMGGFTRTIKKRVDHEVFEVYRHGIMHGSVVNFDNVVVASKAWNMLFAVADWAAATLKGAEPLAPKPTWSDTMSTVKRQGTYRKYQKAFVTATVTPSDLGFESNEVVLRASEFLEAWQHQRWGLVSAFTPPVLASESKGEAAQFSKDVFEQHSLTGWDIKFVTYDRPSTAEIVADATVNGKKGEIRFRVILYNVDGTIAMPNEAGATWHLGVWAPHTFFHAVE
jgi:hypothetical protein